MCQQKRVINVSLKSSQVTTQNVPDLKMLAKTVASCILGVNICEVTVDWNSGNPAPSWQRYFKHVPQNIGIYRGFWYLQLLGIH